MKIQRLFCLNPFISSANASGTPYIVGFYDDCSITIDQLFMQWTGTGELINNMNFNMVNRSDSNTGVRPFVDIRDVKAQGNTGQMSFDGQLSAGTYGIAVRARNYSYSSDLSRTDQATIFLASGQGTQTMYGAHRNLQVVLDTPLTAARSLVLSNLLAPSGIGSGTSETRQIGDIVEVYRDGNATGSYALNVQYPSGTTLQAMSTVNAVNRFVWNGTTFDVY